VNVISPTADANEFRAQITANCRKISMHARPHIWLEPRLAILRAKHDLKDDFTKRLGHGAYDDPIGGRK